ncbi:Mut7-C RNAse domain-containing protein [Candidatus Nitrosotenuis cloacae]|uniref:Mut7-C RNAse domain-containing protein n=1 Tax=Candidatus Nitrosotenuis cloacae TaxID=1603555 RepID=A0A3G1B525_9ARCH|nr:Mut7-C RNAse domain-containing protein [Candidatus Nitrosotenuis cloacae]AJZ76079.1 hypothetical protein SU86_006510 [Candidatus Nitrosotenuis cloacae]
MLGTIAKKLRMLGFDTHYYNTINDDDLITSAKKENRIIITKDYILVAKAANQDIPTIQIFTITEKEQLVEITRKMSWKKLTLDNPRCSICNGILQKTSKQDIIGIIPPKVAESVQEFWQCDKCSHIYWVGTHIRNLERLIAEINDTL